MYTGITIKLCRPTQPCMCSELLVSLPFSQQPPKVTGELQTSFENAWPTKIRVHSSILLHDAELHLPSHDHKLQVTSTEELVEPRVVKLSPSSIPFQTWRHCHVYVITVLSCQSRLFLPQWLHGCMDLELLSYRASCHLLHIRNNLWHFCPVAVINRLWICSEATRNHFAFISSLCISRKVSKVFWLSLHSIFITLFRAWQRMRFFFLKWSETLMAIQPVAVLTWSYINHNSHYIRHLYIQNNK